MSLTLADATEVFARGFAFTRSFTHPYIAERVGKLWTTRDSARASGDMRREEWIAPDVEPAKVDALASRLGKGRFAVCAICPISKSQDDWRRAYKQLGYRLTTTEPMFVHDLKRIPRAASSARIERVRDMGMANRLAKAARSRQILPEHLHADAPPLRQYVAIDGEKVVGWVGSVIVDDATFVSNLNVLSAYRRRGIGRALMARMLRDDRAAGARASVLLASHAGAKLYPLLGYRQIGTLLLYVRAKPK